MKYALDLFNLVPLLSPMENITCLWSHGIACLLKLKLTQCPRIIIAQSITLVVHISANYSQFLMKISQLDKFSHQTFRLVWFHNIEEWLGRTMPEPHGRHIIGKA